VLTLQVTVPDATPVVIGFAGIESPVVSPPVAATQTLCVRVLAGDVNSDGLVDQQDLIAVRDSLGQSVGSSNFRADMNANGAIDQFDLVLVRGRFGHTCGTCP